MDRNHKLSTKKYDFANYDQDDSAQNRSPADYSTAAAARTDVSVEEVIAADAVYNFSKYK